MGRRKRVAGDRRRGGTGGGSSCDCDPLFERLCDRIKSDRRQIVSHITISNNRLSHRLDSLERRTRQEVMVLLIFISSS